MITVISYHVQVSGEGTEAKMAQRHDQWGGRDYERLLQMLGESARWAMPGCRLVVATDLDTPFPKDCMWERFRRRRGDYRVGAHRMEVHAAFLENQPPGKYLFVDTDVLINRDPSEVFDMADVCICSPFEKSVKLNSGVVYVANREAGIEWFTAAAEVVHSLSPEEQTWMGDQYAQQIMAFGHEPFWEDDDIFWRGHHIRVVPSRTTNWSPEPDDGPVEGAGAYVWHFKGPRKGRMPSFHDHLKERNR